MAYKFEKYSIGGGGSSGAYVLDLSILDSGGEFTDEQWAALEQNAPNVIAVLNGQILELIMQGGGIYAFACLLPSPTETGLELSLNFILFNANDKTITPDGGVFDLASKTYVDEAVAGAGGSGGSGRTLKTIETSTLPELLTALSALENPVYFRMYWEGDWTYSYSTTSGGTASGSFYSSEGVEVSGGMQEMEGMSFFILAGERNSWMYDPFRFELALFDGTVDASCYVKAENYANSGSYLVTSDYSGVTKFIVHYF